MMHVLNAETLNTNIIQNLLLGTNSGIAVRKTLSMAGCLLAIAGLSLVFFLFPATHQLHVF